MRAQKKTQATRKSIGHWCSTKLTVQITYTGHFGSVVHTIWWSGRLCHDISRSSNIFPQSFNDNLGLKSKNVMQYIKSSQLIETCTCESLSCNPYNKWRVFAWRKKILPLRQGVKLHKKNWLVTSFSKIADTFVIFYPCSYPQSSKRNV